MQQAFLLALNANKFNDVFCIKYKTTIIFS